MRDVDALVISGGGNDAGFAPVASVCVLHHACNTHFVNDGNGAEVPLEDRFMADVAALPAEAVELATLSWVHWWNTTRLHSAIGDVPPAEFEAAHYAQQQPPVAAGVH